MNTANETGSTEEVHSPASKEFPFGKLLVFLLVILVLGGAFMLMSAENREQQQTPLVTQPITEKYAGKKVLYIDSYHEGYEWSDGIATGITETFQNTGVDLRIVRMDTKRNPSEEWKKRAGADMSAEVAQFAPDVLIVADDNAFKYVVQEYYKDASLPVIFVGLNWDASGYGAPYKNTTGMIEVSLTTQIIEHLLPFAAGDRMGYLSADTETERKNLMYYEKLFNLSFEKSYFVKDMASWKEAFLALQSEVDLVIFENNAGIVDWDDNIAEQFAKEHIAVPVGTTNPWTMKESVLGITKVPNEQGEWAADTALRIFDGAAPADIPLVKNEKGSLIINLALAEKLNIVFPPNILKNAAVAK